VGTRSSQPSGVDIEQQEVQLGDLGKVGLEEDGGALRVDAGGEPVEHHLDDRRTDRRRLGRLSQGMVVGDEEDALVLVLSCTQLRSAPR